MNKFTQDIKSYLRPFWKSGIITNETLMFVGESDAGVLLYEPKEIISVKDYFLDKEYKEGVDFKIDGKKFIRLSDKIPFWREEDYYLTAFEKYRIGVNKEISARFGGERFLKHGDGDVFTKKQIVVTYIGKGKWDGPIPQDKSEKFIGALEKVKSGKTCKFLFYGDSITTGCTASGTERGGNLPPYMPPFPNLICEFLREKYGSDVELINTAVGGKSTKWGLDNLDERVISFAPDLLFIAFGMNDPLTLRETYKETVRQMIEKTHDALPKTEIMLVSSVLPNDEADETWYGNQCEFHKDLAELEKDYDFVGLSNVTVMHEYMQKVGKRYRDITANNINHPNDFGHRLYAQTILATLLGKDFDL